MWRPPRIQGGVIQRILVQGNERIEQSTVISYLPVSPGETDRFGQAPTWRMKALFRTDLFRT